MSCVEESGTALKKINLKDSKMKPRVFKHCRAMNIDVAQLESMCLACTGLWV